MGGGGGGGAYSRAEAETCMAYQTRGERMAHVSIIFHFYLLSAFILLTLFDFVLVRLENNLQIASGTPMPTEMNHNFHSHLNLDFKLNEVRKVFF